ncbi:MAG TPA: hypothetical protein VJ654_03050 [Noviherbaspirillum sp.]|nr:hypothetical protein [Noviherbaspirillum sp.]
MTILTFPSITPAHVAWGLKSNTESFTSPLNGSTQTIERPGARWKATLTMPPLTVSNAVLLDAFLLQLNGKAGRFYLYPHHRPTPRGLGGSGVVSGGGQTGKTLATTGWTAGWLVLRAGDFFQVGSELKMCTADAVASGTGTVTLQFMPALRSAPSNGAAIVSTNPQTIMMLDTDETLTGKAPGPSYDPMTLSCIEVFV